MRKTIIDSHGAAVRTLKCPTFLSNRKQEDYARIAQVDKALAHRIAGFFQQWPMYNDGDVHHSMRGSILSSIKEHTQYDMNAVRLTIRDVFDKEVVSSNGVYEIVQKWHSVYFGIEPSVQTDLMSHADVLVSLVIFHDLQKIPVANRSLDYIEDFFYRKDAIKVGGLVEKLIRNNASIGAVMNLLVDSYAPMHAASTSLIYAVLLGLSDGLSSFDVDEILASMPPFRYINRIRIDPDDGTAYWIGIDILRCNRDRSELIANLDDRRMLPITFGVGRHSCVGYKPAHRFFGALIEELEASYESSIYSVSGSPETDAPICLVNDLLVSRRNRGT